MATTTVMKIKVEELSKFGFKANGKYVNYSKQFPEAQKTGIVPGAEFEGEVYVADSGKEYLNKVVTAPKFSAAVTPEVAKVVDTERAKKFVPKFVKKETASMSKEEWQAKDRSQLIGGLSHDAAQLVVAALTTQTDIKEVLAMHKAALEGLVAMREEVK